MCLKIEIVLTTIYTYFGRHADVRSLSLGDGLFLSGYRTATQFAWKITSLSLYLPCHWFLFTKCSSDPWKSWKKDRLCDPVFITGLFFVACSNVHWYMQSCVVSNFLLKIKLCPHFKQSLFLKGIICHGALKSLPGTDYIVLLCML